MSDKQEEKGQEVDSNLANGPVENRGCTDILCCLLFIAGVAAFVGIAIDGFRKGQPSKLAVPYDSAGKFFFEHFLVEEAMIKNILQS